MADLIKVTCKIKGKYNTLKCESIEVYGDKLAFSDANGELLRDDQNEIINLTLPEIIKITCKK